MSKKEIKTKGTTKDVTKIVHKAFGVEKEFNLSKKRKELYEHLVGLFGWLTTLPNDILKIVEAQDKEFIKELKESDCMGETQQNRIDKLAGEI